MRLYAEASTALIEHPRLRQLWPRYLVATHQIIKATLPMMEAAAAHAQRLAGHDPVAAGVAEYLAKHIEEERDHDIWLLEDLDLLGVTHSAVFSPIPSPTVARLVGAQYYWALHYHPVSLLGYFAFMEGDPPTPEFIDDLIAKTGYPVAGFRCFAAHGELDPHHRAELNEVIDSLPLTVEHEAVIGLAAMSTVELLARMIEEVVEDLPREPLSSVSA
jgi:Iron-containing redox enzyme